jgi:hypothetical protein
MEQKRFCPLCGVELTEANWPKYLQKKNAQRNMCRKCWTTYTAEREKKMKEADPARWAAINQAKSQRWRERHPDAVKQIYLDNKEAMQAYARQRLFEVKTKAMNMLGGKCVDCGITDVRVLQVNHKAGGGTKEKLFGGDMYRAIISGERKIDDLDVRCANHNIIYEYERGSRRMPAPR